MDGIGWVYIDAMMLLDASVFVLFAYRVGLIFSSNGQHGHALHGPSSTVLFVKKLRPKDPKGACLSKKIFH